MKKTEVKSEKTGVLKTINAEKIAIENNFNLNKYIEYNIYNDYINKSDTRKKYIKLKIR